MTDLLKENLQKAEEWLNNLKNTLQHIKDEHKEYATDRIKLLEWLIEQVKLQQETEKEQDKVERYKHALEFYADRENYEPEHYDPDTHDYTSMIDHDKGATARKALEGEE